MIVLVAIICLVIIISGLDIIIENIKCNKNCTFKVNGKIVDMWTEQRYYGHYYRFRNRYVFRTRILIEYKHNNKIYSIIRRVSSYRMYRLFDNVELMINPNNPEEVGKYKVHIKPRELKKHKN